MQNNLGNKTTMAHNIQRYMSINGMERKDLAECIGVPYTTVCDWINAKTYPRIDKIEKMAQVFGISKADLVEEQEKPATDTGDGQIMTADEINTAARKLSQEEQKALLELIKTMLESR